MKTSPEMQKRINKKNNVLWAYGKTLKHGLNKAQFIDSCNVHGIHFSKDYKELIDKMIDSK